MNRDLQELPRFDDKWSFLYFEKGHIEQDVQTVAYMYADKKVPIPIETLSVLMLGPGTTITQAAIKLLAEARCLICWVGEDGVRMYSAGTVGTYSARNLLRQAQLFNDPDARLVVVRRLYSMRFKEPIDTRLSIEQLRGKEGARVRIAYKEAAEEYGIEWAGRNYDQSQWGISDPVNKALSAANSCLYGLCHAAILAVGCSPGIGFIHT
ncbi:MAG: type I-E CRISPR-associated endonuclease Cas1, partial [Leptonema sp. (in: Bacteria)]|nr:type I-E CRISPR-associated endonuclease Cas1 [Leptonema sp. (in: bacteria)]